MQSTVSIKQKIKGYEAFRSSPYYDTGNVPTIGYGTCFYENGKPVSIKDSPISEQRATELFNFAVSKVEDWINNKIKCELNQNQFDALVSFLYNVGYYGFPLKNPNTWKLLSSCNLDGFAEAMLKFVYDNGKILKGLQTRRNEEYNLFKLPV